MSVDMRSTSFVLPKLVLGTMTFGSDVGHEEASRILELYRERVGGMVDTANSYNAGASETMLGELLDGTRNGILLATKVGMPMADAGDRAPLSRDAILTCAEGSLRRLRTDRIDIYYLHQPDRRTPIDETLRTLDELVRSGVVGEIGVSNYAAWQVSQLQEVARREGLTPPTISQQLYNLIARRLEAEYVEFSTATGLANIVYNPLGGGMLTGLHHFDRPERDGRFGDNGLGPTYRQRYWDRQLFDAVAALAEVAAGAGLTLTEAAYRWLLSRPYVASVLVGVRNTRQLESNIRAADGPTPDAALVAGFDEVWRTLNGPAPTYNR